MKVLAIQGSDSSTSINRELLKYTVTLFNNAETEVLNLADFKLPLFSVDCEKELGQPEIAKVFLDKIAQADVIVLSLAEHNGNFSAAFKNIFDWASRQIKDVFQHKPMLLMATSPGKRGGSTVLEVAQLTLPRYGASVQAVFSLPEFAVNFDKAAGRIINKELDDALRLAVNRLQ